jgi:hypothetical protein
MTKKDPQISQMLIGSKLKAESSKRSSDYKNYPQITQITQIRLGDRLTPINTDKKTNL